MKNLILNVVFISTILVSSCKKFVSIDPPKDELINKTVFEDDVAAKATVTGIYSRMISENFFSGRNSVTVTCGFSADELDSFASMGNDLEFYTNSISSNSTFNLWSEPYKYIFTANSIIEGLKTAEKLDLDLKKQLLGEALFIRALCYFYLVNLFGDVPYHVTTDYAKNALQPKTDSDTIYKHLIEDLSIAKTLLSSNYDYTKNERIRPNKYAASALLARIYLYTSNWTLAELEASSIINNRTLYDLASISLSSAFLKNNKESIWQLMPVKPGFNTDDGYDFILTSMPTFASLSISQFSSFEVHDPRKALWVGAITAGDKSYFYPFKYKVKSGAVLEEYLTVFRLAEQYLIRAEARVQVNNVIDAVSDINVVRKRARGTSSTSLPDLSTDISKEECLIAIMKERRAELFAELGHRWFDLKRTGQAGTILKPLKGNQWQDTDVLFPIPHSQLVNNPNMTQNAGYN